MGHPHQHHIGLAGPDLHAGQGLQGGDQGVALMPQRFGLLRKNRGVLQSKQSSLGVEYADVVGWAHFVDFTDQGRGADQVAQAHPRQAKFTQGAHQQHPGIGARMGLDFSQPRVAGEGLVSLVHDHPSPDGRCGLDDATNDVGAPQVGAGVVRISQINQGGTVRFNGRQHRVSVQLKICCERHAHVTQTRQFRTHPVHDKTGLGRQRGGTRTSTGHGQHGNQFVRAIAQHQVVASGQRGVFLHRLQQGFFQVVHAGAGVAVQGHRSQPFTQFLLQLKRQ